MNSETRRSFLRQSAVISSSVVLAGASTKTDGKQNDTVGMPAARPLSIGLMTYNLAKDWDIDTIIRNCADAQFEHVELRTTHAHKVEVSLTARERAEVKKKFEDSALEAISLASAFSYHHDDPALLREHIEGTKEYTILAHDVGARGIRVFPNQLMVDKSAPVEKTLERIGRSLREVADFAKDYGVEIRIANHGRGTNRITVTKQILDYSQSDHLRVNWNCDATDIEGEGFEANFNLVGSRIGNVHMHSLFEENYPYRRLFQLLQQVGYKGYCNAEIQASCEPVRLMKYYRALFLAYQYVT